MPIYLNTDISARTATDPQLSPLPVPNQVKTLEETERWLLSQLHGLEHKQCLLFEDNRLSHGDKTAMTPVGLDNYKKMAKACWSGSPKLIKEEKQLANFGDLHPTVGIKSSSIYESDYDYQTAQDVVENKKFIVYTLWHAFELELSESNNLPVIRNGSTNKRSLQETPPFMRKFNEALGFDGRAPIDHPSKTDELIFILYWLQDPKLWQEEMINHDNGTRDYIIRPQPLDENNALVAQVQNALDNALPADSEARKTIQAQASALESYSPEVLLNHNPIENTFYFSVRTGRITEKYSKLEKKEFIKTHMANYNANSLPTSERLHREAYASLMSLPFTISAYWLVGGMPAAFLLAPNIKPLADVQRAWMAGIEENSDARYFGINTLVEREPSNSYFFEEIPVSDEHYRHTAHTIAPFLYTVGAAGLLDLLNISYDSPLFFFMLAIQFTKMTLISTYSLNEWVRANHQTRDETPLMISAQHPLRTLLYFLNILGLPETTKQLHAPITWAWYALACLSSIRLLDQKYGESPGFILLSLLASASQAVYTNAFDVARFEKLLNAINQTIKEPNASQGNHISLNDIVETETSTDPLKKALQYLQLFPNAFAKHSLGHPVVQFFISAHFLTQLKVYCLGKRPTYTVDLFLKIVLGAMVGAFWGSLIDKNSHSIGETESPTALALLAVVALLSGIFNAFEGYYAERDAVQRTVEALDSLWDGEPLEPTATRDAALAITSRPENNVAPDEENAIEDRHVEPSDSAHTAILNWCKSANISEWAYWLGTGGGDMAAVFLVLVSFKPEALQAASDKAGIPLPLLSVAGSAASGFFNSAVYYAAKETHEALSREEYRPLANG